MNSTSNSSNASYFYYDLDFWLPQFASTWALDSIYLFVITPLALIGMFLNIFTFILLTKKEFHKNKIYSFFKWIALNSALMNLVESGLFSCSTYRYFDFSNSYESNFYGTHVFLPVYNTCYIFGSCLDILLSLERCSIFVNKLKRLFTYPVKNVCLISLAFCILVTFPFFFVQEPAYFDAPIYPQTYHRIWYWGITSFGSSLAGTILAAIGYFVRDVCFLAAEISINIYSIYLFKKFFKSKVSLLKSNQIEGTSSDLNTPKTEITHHHSESQNAHLVNSGTIKDGHVNKRLNIMERNLSLMALILCFFSVFMHIFSLSMTVYYYFSYDLIVNSFSVVLNIIIILKNFSNFILLCLFNVNFRKCVGEIFRKVN